MALKMEDGPFSPQTYHRMHLQDLGICHRFKNLPLCTGADCSFCSHPAVVDYVLVSVEAFGKSRPSVSRGVTVSFPGGTVDPLKIAAAINTVTDQLCCKVCAALTDAKT